MPLTVESLENIQGDILGGFKKDYQSNLFLRFNGEKAARAWLEEIADEISSSSDVIQFNNEFRRLKRQGVQKPEQLISAVWVNLALSFSGLKALNAKGANLEKFPDAFKNGMAKADIGDTGGSDPSKWIPPFNTPADVHAVLIVAADHAHELAQKVAEITGTAGFKEGVKLLLNQEGRTRSDQPGHEHFGFKDGISQPGVRGIDLPDDPIGNPDQGHPGQDLLWPGEFVIGYEIQNPKSEKAGELNTDPVPGVVSQSGPSWTKDGSYLVFRRLSQDVAGFEKNLRDLAKRLGWTQALAGAKIVGRYKSGCPIEQRKFQPGPYTPPSVDPGDPHEGNPALANSDTLNNNFEFGDDPQGAICPLSAHVRKAYPRDEETPAGRDDSESSTQTRRLLRRGIPYGDSFRPHVPGSDKVDRGLLFLAYQNDIANHFEFVQKFWVNNPKFPPNPQENPPLPPLKGDPGQDPIIAQSPSAAMLIDPSQAPVSIEHFVTTTGGEYFFSPSIDSVKGLASGDIGNSTSG